MSARDMARQRNRAGGAQVALSFVNLQRGGNQKRTNLSCGPLRGPGRTSEKLSVPFLNRIASLPRHAPVETKIDYAKKS